MIDRRRTDPWRIFPGSCRLGCLALVLLCNAAPAHGQSPVHAGPEYPLITHTQAIYNMQGAARELRYRFRFDAIVYYYDPQWHEFFGFDGSHTFYMVPPSDHLYPFKPGQLVRLSGEVVPGIGFRPDNLKVEFLQTDAGPEYLPARGRIGDRDALNEHLVEVEGLVDWQQQLDPNHQRFSLVSEGYRLSTNVWLNQAGQAPLLAGSVVRVRGVYVGRVDIDNRLQTIDLNVQGVENITLVGLLEKDPRFTLRKQSVANLAGARPGSEVHVVGRIQSFTPGRNVTIQDDTGILELRTPQARDLHIGADIEAIGIVAGSGPDLHLDQALWVAKDRSTAINAPPGPSAVIKLAAQVLGLPHETAAAQQPVQLTGVISWGSPDARFFFVQDRSGGVRVELGPKLMTSNLSAGLGVTLSGVSAMGIFAPEVVARRLDGWSAMSPPEPQRITLEQAQTGESEARWVEMEGYVRGVESAPPWTQLDLTTSSGEFRALLPPHINVSDKIGAFVRIRGVCDTVVNDSHRAIGVQLWVSNEFPIEVDEAPVGNLFAIPFTPLDALGLFGSQNGLTHWVHTAGIVTYDAPGRFLVIQAGSSHLRVLRRDRTRFKPGDQVDVVGIPGWDADRFVLRESVANRTGQEKEPTPATLRTPIRLADFLDSRLVQLSGILTEVTPLGDEYYVTIRNGTDNIIARISSAAFVRPPESWSRGSTVRATGVYELRYDENRNAAGMELLLRTPADIVILKRAPWWTIERALAVAGVLGACALSVILWVASLRRRVKEQTEEIRRYLEREAGLEAELERGRRLHSLGLLAGGIAHDFNNLLAVIMGNISLALHDRVAEARVGDCLRDAETGSKRARALTQQILTFARGGDPVREPLSLPEVVNGAAALALSGAKSRMEFKSAAGLWPVYADRGQLDCAVQNLITNACAAMPSGGVITMEAANETVARGSARPLAPGRYVRLDVADKGPGIPAGELPGIFDPYAAIKFGKHQFGLATTYSIMQKHGGLIEVESTPGCGTLMRLWIPAAEIP